MLDNENTNNVKMVKTSPGFATLLTLAFIILKLCKVITWSWFWVLSPLIFGYGIFLILCIICGILMAIANR